MIQRLSVPARLVDPVCLCGRQFVVSDSLPDDLGYVTVRVSCESCGISDGIQYMPKFSHPLIVFEDPRQSCIDLLAENMRDDGR